MKVSISCTASFNRTQKVPSFENNHAVVAMGITRPLSPTLKTCWKAVPHSITLNRKIEQPV